VRGMVRCGPRETGLGTPSRAAESSDSPKATEGIVRFGFERLDQAMSKES